MTSSSMNFFPPLKHAVKYGVISGLILIAISTALYASGASNFEMMAIIANGLVTYGVIIFFTIYSIKKTRDLEFGGSISYIQALIVGFVMLLISGYLGNLFSFILTNYIDPDYMLQQIDNFVDAWEGKMPEDMLDETVAKMEASMDPVKNFFRSLYVTPITSLIISAIVSLFGRKKVNY